MDADSTMYLDSTSKISIYDFYSFANFQIWDLPGHVDFVDSASFDIINIFTRCSALIFVIDALDDGLEALQRLFLTIQHAVKINPNIFFEVLIHKTDGLSDEAKIECQSDIHQRLQDDFADVGMENQHVSFYLSSIYDSSIYEAFSKIIQKLIPQLPTLENLLDIFCSNSGIEKAFLFDVCSKIYVATDSSPVDLQTYEICADTINVFIDIASIYDTSENHITLPGKHDAESHSLIKLNNGMLLYSRAVTSFISMVCLVKSENVDRHLSVLEYNFIQLKDAIVQVMDVRKNFAAGQQ